MTNRPSDFTVAVSLNTLSLPALRNLARVLADDENSKHAAVLAVRRIQISHIAQEIEDRTGWRSALRDLKI